MIWSYICIWNPGWLVKSWGIPFAPARDWDVVRARFLATNPPPKWLDRIPPRKTNSKSTWKSTVGKCISYCYMSLSRWHVNFRGCVDQCPFGIIPETAGPTKSSDPKMFRNLTPAAVDGLWKPNIFTSLPGDQHLRNQQQDIISYHIHHWVQWIN